MSDEKVREFQFEEEIGHITESGFFLPKSKLGRDCFLSSELFGKDWEVIGLKDLYTSLFNEHISRYDAGKVKITIRIEEITPNPKLINKTDKDIVDELFKEALNMTLTIRDCTKDNLSGRLNIRRIGKDVGKEDITPLEAAKVFIKRRIDNYCERAEEWKNRSNKDTAQRTSLICKEIADKLSAVILE